MDKQGLFSGAGNVTRTRDLRITNALLYQLSYTSEIVFYYITKRGIVQVFEEKFLSEADFCLYVQNYCLLLKKYFFVKVVNILLMCYNNLV